MFPSEFPFHSVTSRLDSKVPSRAGAPVSTGVTLGCAGLTQAVRSKISSREALRNRMFSPLGMIHRKRESRSRLKKARSEPSHIIQPHQDFIRKYKLR